MATAIVAIDRTDHENLSKLHAACVAVHILDVVLSGFFGRTLDLCSYCTSRLQHSPIIMQMLLCTGRTIAGVQRLRRPHANITSIFVCTLQSSPTRHSQILPASFIVINVSANVSWPSSGYSEGIGQQTPLYTTVHAQHKTSTCSHHNPNPHITCTTTFTPAPAHTSQIPATNI